MSAGATALYIVGGLILVLGVVALGYMIYHTVKGSTMTTERKALFWSLAALGIIGGIICIAIGHHLNNTAATRRSN